MTRLSRLKAGRVQEAHVPQQNTLGGGEGSSACLLVFHAVCIGPGTVTWERRYLSSTVHTF